MQRPRWLTPGRRGRTPPAAGTASPLAAETPPAPTPPPSKSDGGTGRRGRGRAPVEDTGLYAILGVTPTAQDWEIHVAYRKRAAALSNRRVVFRDQLKELNAAHEVLGNPARRAEYDRQRLTAAFSAPPIAETNRATVRYPRFRHPRSGAPPVGSNFGEVVGVVAVLLLSVFAALFFLSRFGDFAPLTGLARVAGLAAPQRPVSLGEGLSSAASPILSPQPAASPAAAASPGAPLRDQFRGTTVSVSEARPLPNSQVTLVLKLLRNGQPVANQEVWATVQFRTTQERVPPTGAVRTDAFGNASLAVSVANATPGFEVKVDVKTLVEGQELSWPASFTPR